MVSTVDPLRAAHRATRLVCSQISELANLIMSSSSSDERSYHSKARGLVMAVDGLVTRARMGPQLLATWGPAPFLVFIFSKAAEAAKEDKNILQLLVREKPSQVPNRIDSTGLSYVLYAVSIIELHRALGIVPTECLVDTGNVAGNDNAEVVRKALSCLDELVNMYIGMGSASFSRLLYSVENLARLITLRAVPAHEESQQHLRSRDYRKALEVLAELCSPKTPE